LLVWLLGPPKTKAGRCVVGVTGFHFHDLRHTGKQFAAQSGAALRDLMARVDHQISNALSWANARNRHLRLPL
jgi:integrase